MLYDGTIRFLNQALAAFESEDPLEFNQNVSNNIIRAQDIINELNLSLNMTVGGEFASTMRGLYTYFDRRLQDSNIQKEETGLREVVQRLTVVRDAWAEMLSKEVDASKEPGRPSLEAHG